MGGSLSHTRRNWKRGVQIQSHKESKSNSDNNRLQEEILFLGARNLGLRHEAHFGTLRLRGHTGHQDVGVAVGVLHFQKNDEDLP